MWVWIRNLGAAGTGWKEGGARRNSQFLFLEPWEIRTLEGAIELLKVAEEIGVFINK